MEVLLAGNTGYLTEEFIDRAFPDCRIVIMGDTMLNRDRRKNIRVYSQSEDEDVQKDIFSAYEFDRVVYFSNYLTFHGTKEGELEQLRRILHQFKEKEKVQAVYITGLEGCYSQPTGKTVLAESAEQLCLHYAKLKQLHIKILRIPYLYSVEYRKDYFYQLFSDLRDGRKIVFQEAANQKAYFLCTDDLAELLFRMFDGWDRERDVLSVPDCFAITFSELGSALKKLESQAEVVCVGKAEFQEIPENDKYIRYRYGWFPRISVLAELEGMYRRFLESREKPPGRREKLREWLVRNSGLWRVGELLIGFLLMELLNTLVGNSAQFRMIDLRLLFVVLMGSVYGMNYGIAAAFLESLSLVAAFYREGTDWMTLFYEPGNWIPFIAYFFIGAVCGYVRLKNRDDVRFVSRENHLVQEKFYFIRRLYLDTLQDKRQYKKQILGSRDSFGKIFDITRQLDVVRPQEIFLKTIDVLEDVLENQTISIYSLGKNKQYARLEAASRQTAETAARSLRISDYAEALEELEGGRVWTNTKLREDYPMYIAGIRRQEGLVLLICVQEADYSQMNLYYLNLLKILCGLVEVSLLRALDYQQAVRAEQYLENTDILKENYFLDRLQILHAMRERRIAEYTVLALHYSGMTMEEADELLQSKIRENDVLGISSDGTLLLILAQTGEQAVPVVIKRLEQAGFQCNVVPQGTEEEA